MEYESGADSKPRGGNNSQFLLEVVNGLSLLVAVCVIGVSAWGLAAWGDAPEGSWENVPSWVFYGAIVFGGFVLCVSVLGCVGAKKRNKCALAAYIVIVLVGLVAQIAVAVYVLGYYNYLGDAKATKSWDKVDSKVQEYIIDGFTTFAKKQPNKWAELQDYNSCCGYNMAEAFRFDCDGTETMLPKPILSTGKACKAFVDNGDSFCKAIHDSSATGLKMSYKTAESSLGEEFKGFCQAKLLDATEKYAQALGIVAIAMVLSTFVAFVAACRLACCVSSSDGGYAEDFGLYGARKQQQQETTGGALTGVAGVNYA